jgi:serine O-acetyltransferase
VTSRRSSPDPRQAWKQAVLRERRTRHPRFLTAVRADARVAATVAQGGQPPPRWGRWQAIARVAGLAWRDDAFLALVLYRARTAGQARGLSALPRLAHRLSMAIGQVCIGDPVVVAPGLGLPHGNVVIDGLVEIGPGTVIAPTVTIGLQAGEPRGPTLGAGVTVADGAKVIGPVTIGDGARLEANAVVVHDVEPGTTVAGIPAQVTSA